jgi:hypothetical protein
VTVTGLVAHAASPLQESNRYPAAGLAVSVAVVPETYVPFPEADTVPELPGSTEVSIVYCAGPQAVTDAVKITIKEMMPAMIIFPHLERRINILASFFLSKLKGLYSFSVFQSIPFATH